MINVRMEKSGDKSAVHEINRAAFGQDNEAVLVDKLRDAYAETISFVAEENDRLVGHILFTPMVIETQKKSVVGAGLAPMAVLPEFQRRGIGSTLVRSGVQAIRESGSPFVVVLGHPKYYPRFGFQRASDFGIVCEIDGVPDEAFMILVFEKESLPSRPGVARYAREFMDME